MHCAHDVNVSMKQKEDVGTETTARPIKANRGRDVGAGGGGGDMRPSEVSEEGDDDDDDG